MSSVEIVQLTVVVWRVMNARMVIVEHQTGQAAVIYERVEQVVKITNDLVATEVRL